MQLFLQRRRSGSYISLQGNPCSHSILLNLYPEASQTLDFWCLLLKLYIQEIISAPFQVTFLEKKTRDTGVEITLILPVVKLLLFYHLWKESLVSYQRCCFLLGERCCCLLGAPDLLVCYVQCYVLYCLEHSQWLSCLH